MIFIQSATIIFVCVFVLGLFGTAEKAMKSLQISAFELCFASLLFLALYGFEIRLMPELSFNASLVALPSYFMLLSMRNKESHQGGLSALILFGTIAGLLGNAVPSEFFAVTIGAIAAFCGLLFARQPVFALMIASIVPIVGVVFASLFDLIVTGYADCDLTSYLLLDAQAFACLFTNLILLPQERKVIKA